jgi:hypothetical protein
MAKKPQPPKLIICNVYKIATKAVFLGVTEAPDEAIAIERGAAEFRGRGLQTDGDAEMILKIYDRNIRIVSSSIYTITQYI